MAVKQRSWIYGAFKIWTILLAGIVILSDVASCSPYFIRQPFNTTVRVGDSGVQIQCVVGNMQTRVQWVKDGFGLGIKKFANPRYTLVRTAKPGTFDLRIVNIQLSDDGEFKCQVQPNFLEGLKGIQSRGAYLNVLVPPKNIVLDPVVGGAISVTHPNTVAVTCSTPETKPASVITWRVGGQEYTGQISNKVSSLPGSKLVTTSSTIHLMPEIAHNGSKVECFVNHPAMNVPVTSSAPLNVMYPPQAPVISQFKTQPVRAGDDVNMKCEAIGGNPLAEITWFIGNEEIYKDYTHANGRSQSILRHRVRPDDNGKMITCRAVNSAMGSPMETYVTLDVYYPPREIILESDPKEGAPETGTIEYTCSYEQSNPKASLDWYIDGLKLPQQWSANLGVTPYLQRSYETGDTSSRTSLTLTSLRRADAKLKIACRASIPEIDYEDEAFTNPIINFPPRKVDVSVFYLNSPVTISSHTMIPALRGLSSSASGGTRRLDENSAFKAGNIIQLRCEARGGNPPPNLDWYYESGEHIVSGKGKAITAPGVKVYTGPSRSGGAEAGEYITSTTLELTLVAEHNGISVMCKSSHSGYKETLSDKEKLKVAFPPQTLTIEQFPSQAVAGKPMSLTCTTSSSNPAAKITWYHKNERISEHWAVDIPPKPGKNQGFVTSSRLQMTPQVEDDGDDITCRAEVEILRETVAQPYHLDVQYQPVIEMLVGNDTFNVTENDSVVTIKAYALSNPPNVSYLWHRYVPAISEGKRVYLRQPLTRDERIGWTSDNAFLTIQNLRKSDDGIYEISATNELGTTTKNISLNVFYPVTIQKISGPEYVLEEGETAKLHCEFESHPLTPVKVSWVKQEPGKGRLQHDVTSYATSSVLTIKNVTAKDRGGYKCIAENGIGEPASKDFTLDLLYAPFFVESSPSKVAVSSVTQDGILSPAVVLPCIVKSRPDATFYWTSGNDTIVPDEKNGFSVLQDVLDFETYRTSLRVTKIPNFAKNESDENTVARFSCVAMNAQGQRRKEIKIVFRGPPDAPTDTILLNVTSQSAIVAWKRGFDGGVDQSFIVRYEKSDDSHKKGEYSQIESKTNRAIIDDLSPDEEYLIRVIAVNAYGQSNASRAIRFKTVAAMAQNQSAKWAGITLSKNYVIAISIIAILIVVFSIIIALITYKRCRVVQNSYKPKTIETDCDSLGRAESSLSSCASTKKHRNSGILGTAEEKERLTMNDSNLNTNRVQCQYQREVCNLSPSNCMELQPSCYLDCSTSRCGSAQNDVGRPVDGSTCSFQSYHDEISAIPTYAQINRFNTNHHSARAPRTPVDGDLGLPRNSSEPRFRQDVAPNDNCLGQMSSTAFTNDQYEKEGLLSRPTDLPLPPSLPLFERRPFSLRGSMRSSNDGYSGSHGRDFPRPGPEYSNCEAYRPYRTLESGSDRFGYDRFSSEDGCCPPSGRNNAHTMGRKQYGYWNSRDDVSSHNIGSIPKPSESCLYNVVSRPEGNCGYSPPISSMMDPSQNFQTSVDSSSAYTQPTGSGVFVKSVDNIDHCMTRRSIVNDDGTINTFGYDHPSSNCSESRSNILSSIRESQSQDPLPGYSTETSPLCRHTPSPTINSGLPTYARSSLRSASSNPTQRYQDSKRGVTPPVRFRDELSMALGAGARSTIPAPTRRHDSSNTSRHSSDDDMDSGCGGSADAVVVDIRTPSTPINSIPKDSKMCVGMEGGDEEEAALFV